MYVFKEIDKSSTIIESNIVNYAQSLTTASSGIQSIKIVSGSTNTNYWNSLNVLFYTSGSPTYASESKFGAPSSNLLIKSNRKKQFLTKYHGYPSSSLITIPQQYFGEKIKEGSFKLRETDVTDGAGVNPIILDDGKGNLYSSNAHHSQSAGALSSSDNYVGNIFYEQGLAVITETGSWSGSKNYSDFATNYTLEFDSVNTIVSHEYSITIQPNEFNHSMNYTLRSPITGSLKKSTSNLSTKFTGSDFSPYITHINLYQNGDLTTPVICAQLPKPIKKSKKIATTFKIKLDI